MALTRYGQIVGNVCTAVVEFDPDSTPVEQMEGTLSATLLPIEDHLGGQWGVGAHWDGITLTQDTPPPPDAQAMAGHVITLQGQVDDLTAMVLEQTTLNVQAAQGITGSNGQAVITFPVPFGAAPRVQATVRNVTGSNYGAFVEVLAISTTSTTVRAWQMRNASQGANAATLFSGATVHVFALGA